MNEESVLKLSSNIASKIESKVSKETLKDNKFKELVKFIKNAKSDSQVKSAINDFIKSKFKDKEIDDSTQIAAGDAAWITYSLNRKAGRGKLAAWLIASSVLTNFLWYKIIKKSDVKSLNKVIADSVRHPVWYVIGSYLAQFVIMSLPLIFSLIALKSTDINISYLRTLGVSSAGAMALIIFTARAIIRLIYSTCTTILLYTNAIRQNDDEDVLSPMEENHYHRFKESEDPAKSKAVVAAEKVVSVVKSKMPDLTDTNTSEFKKMLKDIESVESDADIREAFSRFVKASLGKKFEPRVQEEAVKIMTVTYNLNVKANKSNKEAALIAVSALIKFLYETTQSEGNSTGEMNIFIAKSVKGGFWEFMKWFLITIVLSVVILAIYENYIKMRREKDKVMIKLMNNASWLLGFAKYTIIIGLVVKLCLILAGGGIIAAGMSMLGV